MQIGMIGPGWMGANRVRRLLREGHACVVFDRSPKAVEALVREKAVGASSLADLAGKLRKPRAVGMMVPAAAVDRTIADVLPHLEAGDIADAEATPLRDPGHYRYGLDFADRILSATRFAFGGHEEKKS